MKKAILFTILASTAMTYTAQAQFLSKVKNIINSASTTGLSNQDAAAGIKQALENGVLNGTNFLGKPNGFLGNAAYKIFMPQEVQNVEQKIRNNPIANALAGAYMDKVVTAMNRGAEKAMAQATPIFVNAIRSLTITDAVNIVTGRDGGATDFLKRTTLAQLTAKFNPVIGNSLNQVGVQDPWNKVSSAYNMVAGKNINTDLTAYVTERATEGLFKKIREEETAIRTNPAARTTDLLKRVFAKAGK